MHELPYKPHSYEIWESFSSLNVKCFSYLPCSDNDEHRNIWETTKKRDTGECVNGSRVMVFDSILDYSDFIVELKLSQKLEINKRLIADKKKYIPPNKQKFKCFYLFSKFWEKISNNFESEFLKGDPVYESLIKKTKSLSKVEAFDYILSKINSSTHEPQDPEQDINIQRNSKTIFLYNIILPMISILAIVAFLKVLINVYDKDNL